MRTHRFGRKIKLPATIAITHQIRMRMAQYEIKKAEDEASGRRHSFNEFFIGYCAVISSRRRVFGAIE
jgi:hypothetical protein